MDSMHRYYILIRDRSIHLTIMGTVILYIFKNFTLQNIILRLNVIIHLYMINTKTVSFLAFPILLVVYKLGSMIIALARNYHRAVDNLDAILTLIYICFITNIKHCLSI